MIFMPDKFSNTIILFFMQIFFEIKFSKKETIQFKSSNFCEWMMKTLIN